MEFGSLELQVEKKPSIQAKSIPSGQTKYS